MRGLLRFTSRGAAEGERCQGHQDPCVPHDTFPRQGAGRSILINWLAARHGPLSIAKIDRKLYPRVAAALSGEVRNPSQRASEVVLVLESVLVFVSDLRPARCGSRLAVGGLAAASRPARHAPANRARTRTRARARARARSPSAPLRP